ncbi:FadR/GntR family transcriptional regulator [Caldifermentibacillus hisashii]|uniref:HTH gntR-type domain-containing protein n=2 Tax=Bacillaceae TaxID=186817 RepID=A0A0D0FIZ3_9BACI|nr:MULTISPECIES: FadR/GntR family transcriptional regulator [Bacillaceae]MCB5934160.1 FadR family transcriptional regulator [Bacillus sp. DFI.2.34]AWI11787.1 FadR family transcriptional regulator [Caldibacillus thermoamylovorans]KIO61463.1 hypothetical protein B4166_3586 [Caldibacillus thermoamylovorans]KIO62310.1 hypothetical protein B4065_3239 [Caldibacillus thermoamylovorans]KIO63780.1 hypothetical protein B4064_2998 [Caldibacillus thermoamylovorans]
MEYKRIQTKKIYEEVADSIINMIKNGELKPGEKIESVEKLAKNFGVGRSAIREALNGLRTMGLVEMRQGEGTYVKKFDPSKFTLPVTTAFLMKQNDVKELYEVRKILEVGTASLAAMNCNEEDLFPMEEALNVMENAGGDEDQAQKADTDFHLAIAKATHNHLLISLMGSMSELISETIRETRKVILYSEDQADLLLVEHKQIFEAIKKKDSDLAGKVMFNHLENTKNRLFKYIE